MKKLVLPMLVAISLASCTKKDETPAPATIASVDFLVSGSSAGSHDFYSIENKSSIALADSATTKWDFAIRFDKFIFNSNASGPGNAGVIVINNTFESVTTAPETGYAYDTTLTRLAVKGEQWYTYNPTTRTFAPTAGRTFIIRTATNKFAKLEMITATPTDNNGVTVVPPTRPTKIKYAMRLAYQTNGRVF